MYQYWIHLEEHSGETPVLDGIKFTTRDRDNDMQNCAVGNWAGVNVGGWWHRVCSAVLINHRYENF